MPKTKYWKKRIIEKFIERAQYERYYITNIDEMLSSFGMIEFSANQAWDELRNEELLVSGCSGKRGWRLFSEYTASRDVV